MSSLFGGFFSREAGQQRRAWLDDKSQSVADRLNYALGPQLAPQLGRMAGLAAMFSPGQDVVDAQRAAQDLMDWQGPLDAAGDGSTLAAAFGSMLLPGGVSSYRQGFDDLVDAGVRAHKSGDLHIFAGPKAANADHAAKARAEALEAAGADRADILQDTGWFRGEDGMWRFEIDDREMKLNLPETERAYPAGRAIHHPAFFSAYPELADKLEIGIAEMDRARLRASFSPEGPGGEGGIWVGDHVVNPENHALHEMQHAVQAREGFALGSEPSRVKPGTREWPLFIDGIRRRVPNSVFAEIGPELVSGDPRRIVRAIHAHNLDDAAFAAEMEAYKRTPGEVEARNVQARHGMLPEQRREIPPWTTQDTASRDQVLPKGR
jgi:hypothetical protein